MRLQEQVAIITGVSHAGQVGFALAAAIFLVSSAGAGVTGALLPVQGRGV